MSKLSEILNSKKMSLILSLPKNDPELAQAGIKGGADAFKVHINVHHKASGNTFGTLEEEAKNIKEIIKIAQGKPVGIVPGDNIMNISSDELDEAMEIGIDFYSIYSHHAPLFLLDTKLGKTVAIDEATPAMLCETYQDLPFDAIEASILPKDLYGTPLSLHVLMKFMYMSKLAGRPMIVPTQCKILPSDVRHLYTVGTNGIMIGAIVTGSDSQGVERACYEFKNAMEAIN